MSSAAIFSPSSEIRRGKGKSLNNLSPTNYVFSHYRKRLAKPFYCKTILKIVSFAGTDTKRLAKPFYVKRPCLKQTQIVSAAQIPVA
jgi:hypothetical protein